MSKKRQIEETYDKSAKVFAAMFDAMGARISDIEETLALIKRDNPKVLEIGCGNGRDAKEICKRANDYLGIDVSAELILLAKQKVPNGKFEIADVEYFQFPGELDVIFAFASLLHISKESLRDIFKKIYIALNKGGIFRLSLKYAKNYQELERRDGFGIRTFYLYSENDIKKLSQNLSIIKSEVVELKGQKWLEMLFQK